MTNTGAMPMLVQEFKSLFASKFFVSLFLMILTFFFLLPFLLKPMVTELDAYSRYQTAVINLNKNTIFALDGSVWLPLHATFLIPAVAFFSESTLAPRLLTMLISCTIPIWLFLITRTLTRSSLLSLTTALLYLILPLFTEISTTTLTEPVFVAVFLAAQYYFLTKRWSYWVFFIVLAQMLRFEAWFITPLALVMLCIQKIPTVHKLSLITLLCCFPLVYSLSGYLHAEGFASYYDQMATMAKDAQLPGLHNWPTAVQDWLNLVIKTVPTTYLLLIGIGIFTLVQNWKEKPLMTYQYEEYAFLVIPIFLFLMLPIQVFLHLRDWLPARYLLIPTTLLFPLLGLGIQTVLQKLSLKTYAMAYGLAALVLFFELTSLYYSNHQLLASYNLEDYDYLRNDLIALRQVSQVEKTTEVGIFDPKNVRNQPQWHEDVFSWFLLPVSAEVKAVAPTELNAFLSSNRKKKLLVVGRSQKLPAEVQLKPLLTRQHFTYYTLE